MMRSFVLQLEEFYLALVVSPKQSFGHSLVRLAILFSITCHARSGIFEGLQVVIPSKQRTINSNFSRLKKILNNKRCQAKKNWAPF